jgi:hypothetical protein
MARWDDEIVYDYRETMWFRAFTERVYKVLKKKPQTWRQVRLALKGDKDIRLLVEAVEYLAGKGRLHWDRGFIETLARAEPVKRKKEKGNWNITTNPEKAVKQGA